MVIRLYDDRHGIIAHGQHTFIGCKDNKFFTITSIFLKNYYPTHLPHMSMWGFAHLQVSDFSLRRYEKVLLPEELSMSFPLPTIQSLRSCHVGVLVLCSKGTCALLHKYC